MATQKATKNVPQSFKAGPYLYGVGFDGEAAYDYNYAGVCLFRSKRIKLDPRQSDTELPQTLLHEAIHALGNAYGIEEWDRHTTNDKQQITDKIDLMATALLEFIRANPALIRYLQSG